MSNTNLFDIHDQFFVIDSEHLAEAKTKLYGYTIINDIIVEDAAQIKTVQPYGEGAYVYVCADAPEHITITQDFIGSYGLYLYRNGDYFAISNSFAYLTDYLKYTHKLTFHRDYANHLIISSLCPVSYSETLIEEIEYLDRSAVVSIHIPTRKLSTSLVDYRESTLSPTSEEGLAVLDKWYNKWTNRLRNMERSGEAIQFDLSGGFDSRLTFALALGSGIDMNNVFVYSIDDNLHTHAEDFEIASEIARFYGFPLNKRPAQEYEHFTLEDALNISMYLKMGFHTQMHPKTEYAKTKRHAFNGNAGEVIRNSHWNIPQEQYIQEVVAFAKPYGAAAAREFTDSTVSLVNRAYEKTRAKFKQFGRELRPEDYTINLYRETRSRQHFGRDLTENYCAGFFKHAPLLDADLHQLIPCDEVCGDKDLLMTIILDRYQKDLLRFKFDGNRSIAPETVAYARKINSEHPYVPPCDDAAHSASLHLSSANRTMPQNNNPKLETEAFYSHIRKLFNTKAIRNTFISLYDESTCNRLYSDVNNRDYQPLMKAYTVIGICRAYEATVISREALSRSVGDSFVAQSVGVSFGDTGPLLNHPYLSNYITARLDLQNCGSDANDLVLTEMSDRDANVIKPDWMSNGSGYIIHSTLGSLSCTFRCVGSGTVNIALKSRDVRYAGGQSLPFRIDYEKFSINGTPLLTAPTVAWHDQPIFFEYPVKDGDILRLSAEWTLHKETEVSPMLALENLSIKRLAVYLLARIRRKLLGR